MIAVVSWRIFWVSHLRPYPLPCINWPNWSSPTNMSTASMATTSAEMDLTLVDDPTIANWICILVATRGSGTPLGPTSFGEEDAIKLCVGLGQEHCEVCYSSWTQIWSLHFHLLPIWWPHHVILPWPWIGMASLSNFISGPNDQAGKELHCPAK